MPLVPLARTHVTIHHDLLAPIEAVDGDRSHDTDLLQKHEEVTPLGIQGSPEERYKVDRIQFVLTGHFDRDRSV